jgi:hypothetical protein
MPPTTNAAPGASVAYAVDLSYCAAGDMESDLVSSAYLGSCQPSGLARHRYAAGEAAGNGGLGGIFRNVNKETQFLADEEDVVDQWIFEATKRRPSLLRRPKPIRHT